ncbi:DUF4123 domain-containing protein [Rhizobium terrae]|uniref:DUF4123 domain-containing protein n=1 Tax=Rhizobium terrae TaxID=2171756 RepID=UPI000E3BA9E5|nr:DUF4123 domain-containing protein [Rhizobium terrae]
MDVTEQLKKALLLSDRPLFAVLDGAQFEDLPGTLFGGNFVHRALYLDRGDGNQERVATAPQLIWLDRQRTGGPVADEEASAPPNPEFVERLLAVIDAMPAAVFWQCSAGGEVLYRHLRTINMVLVPHDTETDHGRSYEASPLPPEDKPETSAERSDYTAVLFRHADANVMAQVLPSLNPAQFSRLLGPADALLFSPDPIWTEDGGIKGAKRTSDLPAPRSGMLRLEDHNIRAIGERRNAAAANKVADYLRKVAPARVSEIEDDKLRQFASRSIRESSGFGVETDAGHCRWAYMSLVTSGQLGRNPAVREAMQADAPGYSADMRVAMLMRHSLAALKQQAIREER